MKQPYQSIQSYCLTGPFPKHARDQTRVSSGQRQEHLYKEHMHLPYLYLRHKAISSTGNPIIITHTSLQSPSKHPYNLSIHM